MLPLPKTPNPVNFWKKVSMNISDMLDWSLLNSDSNSFSKEELKSTSLGLILSALQRPLLLNK